MFKNPLPVMDFEHTYKHIATICALTILAFREAKRVCFKNALARRRFLHLVLNTSSINLMVFGDP